MRLNEKNVSRLLRTIWNNMRRVHFQRQEYNEAMHAYKTALAIQKQKYDDFHVEVAVFMFNISETYHRKQEFDHALKIYTLPS